MTGFDKNLLHFYVRDSLRGFSENFVPLQGENPFRFRLNETPYSVHISFVHDSGESRVNEDETRIQISRTQIDLQRDRQGAGDSVAFVGFFEDGEVFVGWDPQHVFSLRARTAVSIYARQSMQNNVGLYKTAVHEFNSRRLGRTSRAIALPKAALGFYLENVNRFHSLESEAQIADVLDLIGSDLDKDGDVRVVIDSGAPHVREKFELTRVAYKRDPKFRVRVLEAYENRCCVCGTQLGIIQAAHIVPHALPECTDDVTNGLAMCPNHHRLYDDGLLLPSPGRLLRINEARAQYLTASGRSDGLEEVRRFHEKQFFFPECLELHPSEANLEKGYDVRVG